MAHSHPAPSGWTPLEAGIVQPLRRGHGSTNSTGHPKTAKSAAATAYFHFTFERDRADNWKEGGATSATRAWQLRRPHGLQGDVHSLVSPLLQRGLVRRG